MSCLRPDRLHAATSAIGPAFFGATLTAKDPALSLLEASQSSLGSTTPVILCAPPGYDAAFRVEHLAQDKQMPYIAVAMGSAESIRSADQAIAQASRVGGWVLLKNVHLSVPWLAQLDKRLRASPSDPNFRLFLTMETTAKVPVSILLQSRIIMNEPAPGVRAALLDSLQSIGELDGENEPAETSRLFFLLSWFHAVVQERSRYNPVGWSQAYEFNDADFVAAVATARRWVRKVAQGRANIDPAAIPWLAIRSLMVSSIYGGRIDSEYDAQILRTFVDNLFVAEAFDTGFGLVKDRENQTQLALPDVTSMAQFIVWAKALPESDSHVWLGLPAQSETVLAEKTGQLQDSNQYHI